MQTKAAATVKSTHLLQEEISPGRSVRLMWRATRCFPVGWSEPPLPSSPCLLCPTLVAETFTGNSTQEPSSGFHNWMDSEDFGMGLSMTSKFRTEDAVRQSPSTIHRTVFHVDPHSLSSPFLLWEGKDLSPPVSMYTGVFQAGSLPLITERLSLWLHVPLCVFLAEMPIHLISFTGLRKLP